MNLFDMNLFELAPQKIEKIYKELKTSEKGISWKEAVKRQAFYGENSLLKEQKTHYLLDFLGQFKNPLILILLAAAGVSFAFGQEIDAAIVIVIVLVSTILNFLQERKAGNAARKLTERLVTKVDVARDGNKIEVDLQNIYPGDLIFLNAGDLIPADCRLVSAKDFFVNQSSLTGESFPVEKTHGVVQKSESLADLHNTIFFGTNVITGTAKAVVLRTGKETEFGKIAHNLSQAEGQTDFTLGVSKFSNLILKMTIFIVLAIFFFNILLKKDVLQSFLFAIAVAVGLTPELLPMILAVTMGAGSVKMANKGIIVKKLVAIPNFGSMDILCTDKTGTLTEDRIALVKYNDVFGKDSEEVLLSAYLNSIFQTGISNPMDEAVKKYKDLDISAYKKVDEIPFDFLRKRMSVVVQKAQKRTLICKGAPEEVFKQCTYYLGAEGKKIELTAKNVAKAEEVYFRLSTEGYRVVAIAVKNIADGRKSYKIEDESELMLLGFIAFLDPAKADAKEVILELERVGVKIKIITGDNELVTQRICEELDIPVQGILLGHQIDGMTDDALRVSVEKNTIFARFSPDEKNRIIHALRANGHVVGYMGDGINDAPSLKTADVGISVQNAVDVAKEAADIILTDKSLRALLDGILEGRKTFGNSMKYIMMGVSSNFGNMFSVIGAVIFLPFLPMLPIQILFNNLLYDFSQITIPGDAVDEEYVGGPKRWDMKFVKKFMVVFGLISSCFDFITFYVLYQVFHLSNEAFQTGWFIQSLATQTLIIHVIRTKKIPFLQSRASNGLIFSTLFVVAIGWILPFTALGPVFNFVMLPPTVLLVIGAIVAVYLVTVEIGKRLFYKYVPQS